MLINVQVKTVINQAFPFLASLLDQALRVVSLVDTSKYVLTGTSFLATNPGTHNVKFQVLESNSPIFWLCGLLGFY